MASLLVAKLKHNAGEQRTYNAPAHGLTTGEVIPISAEEVIFGRSANRLRDSHPGTQGIHLPSTSIYKFHATLRREGTLFTIDNNGSASGTFLNGNLVRGPVFLRDGDEISMGDFVFVFQDETGWEAFTVPGLDKVMLCTLLSLLRCGCPEREFSRLLRLIEVVRPPAGGGTFILVVHPEQVSSLAVIAGMSETEFKGLAARWGGTEELRGRGESEVFALLRRVGGLAASASSQGECLLLWQGPGESA